MRALTRGMAIVALGVGALVAAVVVYGHRGYHTPRGAGVVPVLPLAAAPTSTPIATPATGVHRLSPPLRVAIASIGVDARVVPVSVRSGALDVPTDPQSLGWWSGGARPGSAEGSVVVVGHVDSKELGRGALYHLESVPIGARITVRTAQDTWAYRVVARRVYLKQALPPTVFATSGRARLVLITCGGPYDARTMHYADNIVVYAVPAS